MICDPYLLPMHLSFLSGWKLGTQFYGPASIKKMSPSQLKAVEEGAKDREEKVPSAGSLAAKVWQLMQLFSEHAAMDQSTT